MFYFAWEFVEPDFLATDNLQVQNGLHSMYV